MDVQVAAVSVDQIFVFFFQAEDGMRDATVTGVQTCALPIWLIIAAACLHDPGVIIVDEPMVGLDPNGIRMVKELLKDKAREGTTVFMSTHSLGIAEDICDRIGIINRGSLIATGTMNDLKLAAGIGEADLEAVFLKLTEENDSP